MTNTNAGKDIVLEDALFAFLKEISAQMGEPFDREDFDKEMAKNDSLFEGQLFAMKLAIEAAEQNVCLSETPNNDSQNSLSVKSGHQAEQKAVPGDDLKKQYSYDQPKTPPSKCEFTPDRLFIYKNEPDKNVRDLAVMNKNLYLALGYADAIKESSNGQSGEIAGRIIGHIEAALEALPKSALPKHQHGCESDIMEGAKCSCEYGKSGREV